MTTHEAAERLGINARSVARLINIGKLTAVKRGRDWWIEEAEVERFERERNPVGRPKKDAKTCPKCGIEKPFNEYSKSKRRRDGLDCRCKLCEKARHHEYWKTASPEIKARNSEWGRANAEHVRAHDKERSKRPERRAYMREASRRYYQRNIDSRRAETKQYMATHIEWRREIDRKRSKKPTRRATKRASALRYYQRNKEQALAKFHTRRARILGNGGGTYTAIEWHTLCAEFDHRCARCLSRVRLTRDHVIPITSGGVNTIDNIQPLCAFCNRSKHTKSTDYRPVARILIASMRIQKSLRTHS